MSTNIQRAYNHECTLTDKAERLAEAAQFAWEWISNVLDYNNHNEYKVGEVRRGTRCQSQPKVQQTLIARKEIWGFGSSNCSLASHAVQYPQIHLP